MIIKVLNRVVIMVGIFVLLFFSVKLFIISGEIKLKLVFWMDNRLELIGFQVLICSSDVRLEVNSDMLIICWVFFVGSFSVW